MASKNVECDLLLIQDVRVVCSLLGSIVVFVHNFSEAHLKKKCIDGA